MENFKSISESLSYPVCEFCGRRIRIALGQLGGHMYHVLEDENGHSISTKETSCLEKALELERLKALTPRIDLH